jgi:hypothetical protein
MLKAAIRQLSKMFSKRTSPNYTTFGHLIASCFDEMEPLTHELHEWLLSIKAISMLHVETLTALYHLAQVSQGTIVEVGPYVGGSTIVMAKALQGARNRQSAGQQSRRFFTVEVGGSYPKHPSCPSQDILVDLLANLRRHGVHQNVEVLKGWSCEPHVSSVIEKAAQLSPIGLMVLDANGMIQFDVQRWWCYCRPGCYLVCDDYIEEKDRIKCGDVKPYVDRLVRQGNLEPMGVLPWGTWFGRMLTQPRSDSNAPPAIISWQDQLRVCKELRRQRHPSAAN